jgi:hypothetical protein
MLKLRNTQDLPSSDITFGTIVGALSSSSVDPNYKKSGSAFSNHSGSHFCLIPISDPATLLRKKGTCSHKAAAKLSLERMYFVIHELDYFQAGRWGGLVY